MEIINGSIANLTARGFGNSTTPTGATLTPQFAVKTVIAVTSFILNFGLLIVHIMRPAYINHFTVYLLFLYIANTVYLAGAFPFIFLSEVYNVEFSFQGLTTCLTFSYFHWVVSLVPVMCHMLIALNRLWALTYPLGYRNYHTRNMACLICVLTVLYVHLFKLPSLFMFKPNAYQVRLETSQICSIPVPQGYFYFTRVDSILNRFAPLFIIAGVYAYLVIKRFSKKLGKVTDASESVELAKKLENMDPGNMSRIHGAGRPPRTVERSVVRPFLILTLTTISVIICWLPLDVILFYQWFLIGKPSLTIFTVFQYCHMMYMIQLLFDPIMWIVSFRKARKNRAR
ncbi:uncharacterized protein LOC129598929 [Paramacrobiotus metropolitanus]|uniref:uncharacterized protein LOC129598929 n=1 Tax=Paramacrobiotus metropolitanus TaxID=2943436 RepID=UPI0024460EEA|nr:uncharacterized protein LOC129598929 [Paramacrobiotus metropolitanus]